MEKKHIRLFFALMIVIALTTTQVAADIGFTFTTPGSGEEQKSEAAQKIEMMMEIIKDDYYKDVKDEDLINGAIRGMLETLDPHSTYFNAEEFNEFMSDISGEIVGIGVQIEKREDGITVVAPIEDTPAYNAGLKTGDKIVSVDETDITGYTADKAASLIKGEEGTKVRIGIKRDGVSGIIYYELIRDIIEINPVKYEIKDDNIGYLRITQFNDNTTVHVKEAVEVFKTSGVKDVIIDLRGNPGGVLDEVVDVCSMLIPKGPIVKVEIQNRIEEVHESQLDKAPFRLAVLVDGGSASASEIMAGAIKDSKVGVLIGEKTYGKGTVQKIIPMQDGDGAKLTIANYLTPSGFSLDGIGITPDIEVKRSAASATAEFSAIKGDRSLKSGIIGLDVLGLQQRLSTIGYKIDKLDGIFGGMTKSAVLAFQKDNKLKQDASIEADDIKVLQNKLEEKLEKNDPQLERAIEELKK